MITREQCVERYGRAWESADADEIADLFTPDASATCGNTGRCKRGSQDSACWLGHLALGRMG